ncbi:family 78 glycoside hydrolase catalytic domain, partial [Eubacteriales bacterium OttesenSCG-928-A19]|nr:family 78 glycoside hydrolase catalytic domain [Eubacteriales bacterium OttesenSCG-928-A19]
LSPPVRVTERLTPKAIFTTPAGEIVLDLGQEITGYLEFRTDAPRGTRLSLYYFEILQDGNYYRDNLRTALEEYHYTAGGGEATVRPYFTFYGFRYVKLEGFDDPKPEDFTGCAVHSDIPVRVAFTSGNEKVNRLAQNVLWGQRGNFLDVPTDCPQRDERMGWTGDAQAFAGTACFQMESAAFFDKYLYDMRMEQEKLDGSIPHVVPAMGLPGHGSCAWADAAAVIPWTRYLFYGDKAALRAQYPVMRDWVEWIYRVDEATGGRRVWDVGFHFADWLALDTKDGTPMGGTDPYFVATAYYFYSTTLVLKAATALGIEADIQRYTQLQREIFDAVQREYFTLAGRLAQTTQTGYVCALFMGMATEAQAPVLARLLAREFEQTHGELRTGFVGTTYLCRALSKAGLNDLAYSLLLREAYPGWLYEVDMGATTVWERWNSVMPDGHLSDTGMNSLNHYAYGAVMEWVFRDVAGLNPVEEAPGFRRALLRPRPDARLPHVSLRYEAAVGSYLSEWTVDGRAFTWQVEVPFGATALAVFPGADPDMLSQVYPSLRFVQHADGPAAELSAGTYAFAYEAVRPFLTYGMDTPLGQLMDDAPTAALLAKETPGLLREAAKKPELLALPLREALNDPFAEIGVGVPERLTAEFAKMA